MDRKLPVDFPKLPKKSVPYCCALRENGFYSKCNGPPKYLQWAAEDKLVTRNHEEFGCKLPDVTKSVFLMVFSPDGKKIASTHGNHNVYVTDLTNRKNVMTLSGHPRTPWCIAFHPSSNQILASGCLGGQVRVWDLHGGSEIWSAESHTVIASLAFHPIDRVLVIASYNELHFWDWSQQKPFAKCSTDNEKEKVRYVAFDQLGHKLITGIANAPHAHSQWDRVSAPQPPPQTPQTEHERRITICYRYMVEQYEQLVQRYFDISRRSALTAATAERGTDPMEHDEENRQERGGGRSEPRTSSARDDGAVAGPSRGIRRSRHSAMGTDEISASHSSSQFLSSCFFPRQNSRTIANNSLSEPSPSRTEDSNDSHPLGHIRSHSFVGRRCSGVGSSRITPPPRMEEISSPQSDRLWERLHHLRAQVESGRQILATARSATAAITARMSPSAPEDANFLIENLLPSDWTSVSPSNFVQHGTRGRSNSSSSLPPGSDFQNSDRSSNISTQNNDLGTVADGNLRTYWRENNALPLLIDLSRSSDLPTRVVRPNPLNSSLHSHEHGRSQDDLYISTIPNLVPPLPPPPPPPPPLPPPPLPLRSSAPSQNRPGSSGENPFLKRLGTLFRLSRIENLGDAQDLRTTNNRNPNSTSQTSPSSSTHKRNSNVKRLSSGSNSERSDLSQRSLQNSASGSRSNPEEQASNHSSVSSNSLSKNIASGLARLYVAESAEATINALETMNGRRLTAEEIHLIERSKKTKAPVQEIASSSNVARSSGTFSRSNTDEQSTSNSEQSSSSTSRALTMEEWTNMNPENLTLEESIPVWESFFGRSLAPGEAEAILRFRRQVVTGSDSVNRANGSLTRRQVLDAESPSISGSTSSSSISAPPRVEPSNQSLSNGASSRTNRGEQSTNNAEPSSSSSSRVLTAEEWASMNPEELEESIPLWESFFGRSLAPGEAEAILRLRRYGTARTDALNVRCPNGSLTSSQADSSVPSTSTAPLSERILRRVSDTIATVRLRTELRRLQHTYQHGENEQASHLLNEDAEAAERRLLMRFRSPNNRLFTLLPNGVPLAIGTPNRCASLYNSPDDLRNIRSGIMFFSIHINEMFKLCRNVRADAVQLQQIERLWEDLQSQISALHRIVRDEPIPIAEDLSMRGGRGTGVGIGGAGAGTSSESGAGPSESGASTEPTSSLNTDDDSDGEGSSSGLTGGPGPRRQLFSFRRFRFLQRSPRASAAKRARYESAVRAAEGLSRVHRPRTRPQTNRDSSSGQTTGTDEASDDTGEEGNRREHPRPGQSGTEQPKTELPKPEQPKPEQPKPEQPKPEQPRPEQSKSEQSRPQQSRPQQSRPQQSRPQQSRPQQSRPEQSRPEQSTPEHSTPEQSTPGQSRPEQHRANTSTSALPSSTSHSGVGERGVPYRRKERLHVFHLTPPSEYGGRVNRLILQPGSNRARLCQARVNRYRVNLGQQPRFWQRIPSYRSQPSQSTRDFSSQTPPFTQDAAVGTGSESSSQSNSPARDCLRRRTRNVLLLMVDSLTQFFENDKIYRRVSTEMLHERITNLHSLLQLAVKLTELLLSQPELSRRESEVRSANYRTLRFQREGFRRFLRRSLDGPSERVVSGPSRRSHSLLSGSVRGHRVPILRVNDGPVPSETPPPLPRDPGDRRDPPPVFPPSNVMTAHWRPRFLHPRYMGPNPFEESTEDSSSIERENFLFMRGNGPTSVVLTDTPTAPHHRIQAWDFSKYQLPEIHNATKNIVVSECKIHNDASVDLSSDGTLLVTLLPSGRLSITTMLGIYSLQWETLGQCLYTTSFEQNAVSVSLSPTTRHLIVGLASKRLNMFSIDRHTIAQVMKLEGGRPGRETGVPSKGRLVFVRDIELDRDIDFMSLNCIRWIPTPGAGFVYGTNTGLLKILR